MNRPPIAKQSETVAIGESFISSHNVSPGLENNLIKKNLRTINKTEIAEPKLNLKQSMFEREVREENRSGLTSHPYKIVETSPNIIKEALKKKDEKTPNRCNNTPNRKNPKNLNFNSLGQMQKYEIHNKQNSENPKSKVSNKKKSNPLPRVKLPTLSKELSNTKNIFLSQQINPPELNNEIEFQKSSNFALSQANRKKLLPIKIKKFTKTIAVKSREGFIRRKNLRKTNQDNFLILEKLLYVENFALFCIFDGHGINGHFISLFLRQYIEKYFKNNEFLILPRKVCKNIEEEIFLKLESNCFEFIRTLFDKVEKECRNLSHDSEFSGSTVCMVIIIGKKLICANTGDSRGILVSERNRVTALSNDHKPEVEAERARIMLNGGRVAKANDFGVELGPFRVWLKEEAYPGLAMSRSIGDFCAKAAGVIHDPEIMQFGIFSNAKFVVLGSDGLWDCLSNVEVADLVLPYYQANDVGSAVATLVEAANRSWVNEVGIFNLGKEYR